VSAQSATASGHVTIVFTSDWGVSTGVGQAGRTHSRIEHGRDGQPVVRGTVITGVLREQAFIAARALDGAAGTPGAPGAPTGHDTSDTPNTNKGPWVGFAEWLFGQDPDLPAGERPHPRHVVFSDASPIAHMPVHDTVSLSIDPDTGTARDQMLRFTERAAPGVLAGTFRLIDEAGAPLDNEQALGAALFLLGVAGLMVRGIGSGRSGGDGECTVAVTSEDLLSDDQLGGKATEALTRIQRSRGSASSASPQEFTYTTADVEAVAKALRGLARKALSQVPTLPKKLGERERPDITIPVGDCTKSGDTTWYEATLDIVLESPVVSYEVPFSNEVRSLDFLRGTVLLPWLHGLLRARADKNKKSLLAEAVTGGHLLVSNALPVIDDLEGLPAPLTLKTEKSSSSDSEVRLYGGLGDDSPADSPRIPVRGGYVFLNAGAESESKPDSGNSPSLGWYGAPPMRGRQTTAINSETGAASNGQLVLVEALPEGMQMRAHVWMSDALWEACRIDDLLDEESEARLGSRKLTGTFGSARCTLRKVDEGERKGRERFGDVGSVTGMEAPGDGQLPEPGTGVDATIWFTSDVIARSDTLGPGGTVDDLLQAFKRRGVTLQTQGVPAIRYRRVDSWSPADNGPRATRLAIQAGSVIRVTIQSTDVDTLRTLGRVGVGELTAQGYGRFEVNHPLLDAACVTVPKAKPEHFISTSIRKGGDSK